MTDSGTLRVSGAAAGRPVRSFGRAILGVTGLLLFVSLAKLFARWVLGYRRTGELTCKGDDAGCPGGAICVTGKCVPAGCVADPTACKTGERCGRDGKCGPDPCGSKSCTANEYCDPDGNCAAVCQACGTGEVCGKDGRCIPDSCAGVTCGTDEVCVGGKCAADECKDKRCKHGRVCRQGQGCVPDPCLALRCPGGTSCRQGRCSSSAAPVEPVPEAPGERTVEEGPTDPAVDAGPPEAGVEPGGPDKGVVDVVAGDRPARDTAGPADVDEGAGCGCRGSEGSGGSVLLLLFMGVLVAFRRARTTNLDAQRSD